MCDSKAYVVGKITRSESLFVFRLSDGKFALTSDVNKAYHICPCDVDSALMSYMADRSFTFFQLGRNI